MGNDDRLLLLGSLLCTVVGNLLTFLVGMLLGAMRINRDGLELGLSLLTEEGKMLGATLGVCDGLNESCDVGQELGI